MKLNLPYISIEGIKGSGKTLVADLLSARLESQGLQVARFNATQQVSGFCIAEYLFRFIPAMRKIDWFNEWLYACRAVQHSRRLSGNPDLIIGDRSIITSYVTRWKKWGDPAQCIRRVDRMQAEVPVPDHVIWLYCEPSLACQRIQKRPPRNYGRHDETVAKLQEAHDAYYAIFSGCQPYRLRDSQWWVLNGEQQPEDLVDQLFNHVVMQVLKNKNLKNDNCK